MKHVLVMVLMLTLWVSQSVAQDYAMDQVQYGRIILVDGDTVEAGFSINLANEILQVDFNSSLRTFTARQVERFDFTDEYTRLPRNFVSLPFSNRNGYKIPMFFEIVLDGSHLALLAREQLVTETTPVYDGFSNNTVMASRNRIIVEHYFLNEKGQLFKYQNRKKDLYHIFADKKDEMKDFISASRLSYTNRQDLVKITDYYNYLKSRKYEQQQTLDTSK